MDRARTRALARLLGRRPRVARVRVGSIEGDVFHVVILASSGARPGERLTYKRESLYAAESDGRRMFEELIAFL